MNEHFDVIIIGTGAGGGTLLHRLAGSGTRILVLERGPFLPREKDNWNYHGSFKYYSSEVLFNKDGGEIRPGFSYHVGGNTKVEPALVAAGILPAVEPGFQPGGTNASNAMRVENSNGTVVLNADPGGRQDA